MIVLIKQEPQLPRKWRNLTKTQPTGGEHIKFLLKLNNQEDVEQVITYNQLLDYLEKDESQLMEDAYWSFKDIIAHQGPLTKEDPHYKGSSYNVMIEWDTGETTYEPLSLIIQDDSITCAVYDKKHGLLKHTWLESSQEICQNQQKTPHSSQAIQNLTDQKSHKVSIWLSNPQEL